MAFKKENKVKTNFTKITISLASPEEILENSYGEVLKPETINYRTYKPERDGLFCERIFGPTKDYECNCGKYKRIRYKGTTCDRCGVMVTEKKVRRERMGHIALVVPVAHIWYFRSLPNKIGYLLGLPTKKLDAVIYYERYIIIQTGAAADIQLSDADRIGLTIGDHELLTEEEYWKIVDHLPEGNQQLPDEDPQKFIAMMGAEAIEYMLKRIDLDKLAFDLRAQAGPDVPVLRRNEALKCLQVVEAFRSSRGINKPEWMIMHNIPVTPPDLRPLVPLEGGRFATSDLNDLYRRVIIRNNRLKRLIEIKAPEVILRNEKRMLQEAVDSLFDNSRKSSAVKSESNRPLKSLSDSLKGKQGRFRQNLLGKRVDYSARSVIVVGPELKMGECGLPKLMAAELYKPFIIRKLIERGIVKTVKSAKKIVDRRDDIIWDILEYVMKGRPVLLNRAPTLHRLGIQAFQPKLIEGKAIQLHPLACTAFNADFDGDQMAVHLPLSNEANLEAQLLMLQSHNILSPASGEPITVPSQDMVLGLYYISKERPGDKGAGLKFYGPEEAIIAYNEGRVSVHAPIQCKVQDLDEQGNTVYNLVETTIGRIIINDIVPDEIGFVNEVFDKKVLKKVITKVIRTVGMARACDFLDGIKNLGYRMAYEGGLSFVLDDIIIPEEKDAIVAEGQEQVEQTQMEYAMGLITEKNRYQQVISIWGDVNKKLTDTLMKQMREADQGFNAVYMMLHSGARGSEGQIAQLAGMRGLMAKPQKAGASEDNIIENPILSNFKEGMSVLEYFISTHGARKGLADTALKTADAGYLTRRLVDVSHDVIINEEDCGTLRGLTISALKQGDRVVAKLADRILGRVSLHDVYTKDGKELIVASGEEINERIAAEIEAAGIDSVEVRSVLTCESSKGVCVKCYGRNLATARMVQRGEAVGVIAAQAIGEPGTQLTLRTFHSGGVAGSTAANAQIVSNYDCRVEFDELRTIPHPTEEHPDATIVVGRLAELRFVDETTGIPVLTVPVPYGAELYYKEGDKVKKGDVIATWDAFNAVIVSEFDGVAQLENVVENVTYRVEHDETTNISEFIVTESRDRAVVPVCHIVGEDGQTLRTYNFPIGGHIVLNDTKTILNNRPVKAGDILVKIPRTVSSSGDITGGLPRVTELFEARNPSNPAVVAEIDGEISMGKVRRGNREVILRSKLGDERHYQVPLSKQILVQENDYVRAGTPLSDGAITPADILAIKGPTAVQEYIVNEVQDVYRGQGVSINDKHFEIIVRQMMRRVLISEPGDTRFLEGGIVDKLDFTEENDRIWGKKVVVDSGDSENLVPGMIVSARKLRDENAALKRRDLRPVKVREAITATAAPILQGITRAALGAKSFVSAASFQETTKVLNEAAIAGKSDTLEGMKENVICGHLIPAGTGMREFNRLIVGSKDELKELEGDSYEDSPSFASFEI